jgi:hypothetical protein
VGHSSHNYNSPCMQFFGFIFTNSLSLGDKKNNVRVFHLNSPTQHDVVQKSVWDSVWELFYRLLW